MDVDMPTSNKTVLPASPIIWTEEMAPPVPYLVPSLNGEPVEVLEPEKPNQKLKWAGSVEICEIENRMQLDEMYGPEEDEDDNSYEIEIVEDDGDADFYLEIVDGEIFYVFETEDDEMESSSDEESDSDSSSNDSEPRQPLQFSIESMMAPQLDFDNDLTVLPVSAGIPVDVNVVEDDFMYFDDEADQDAASAEEEPQLSPVSKTAIPDRIESPPPLEFNEPAYSPQKQQEIISSTSSPQVGQGTMGAVAPPLAHSEQQVQYEGEQIVTPVTSPVNVPKQKVPMSSSSATDHSSPVKSILKACPPSPHSPRKKNKNKGKKEKTVTKRYVRADNFDGEQMVFTWEKPQWTESTLKKTDMGADVRKGANLANPITFPKKKAATVEPSHEMYADDKGNTIDKEELIRRIQAGDSAAVKFVPLPTYGGKQQKKLKCSVWGEKMRSGANLAKPVTMATVNREKDDINHIANKQVLKNKVEPTAKKTYQWEKPEWAKRSTTSKEEKIPEKNQGDTSSATAKGIEVAKKEYTWEKPEWAQPKLSATKSGSALKSGKDLQSLITHLPARANGSSADAEAGKDKS
jgi:hypothetical protein